MSIKIESNSQQFPPSDADTTKFEFQGVQIGSIFLKDNGDGKVSLNDFSSTTSKLSEFISQYADGVQKWTKDTYNAIVNYLTKHKEEIKNDSINETISAFKLKSQDNSQIKSTKTDGDWTITEFKDGTSMRENKSDNKVRYFDAKGRWVAGTNSNGVSYLNTYTDNKNLAYSYMSEEIGNNEVFYYTKDDRLLMTDDGNKKTAYVAGNGGKLKAVALYNKTGKLEAVGYADENERITDYKDINNNSTLEHEIEEIKDKKTGKITYKKVIDYENHTMTITENGKMTVTDMLTMEVKKG